MRFLVSREQQIKDSRRTEMSLLVTENKLSESGSASDNGRLDCFPFDELGSRRAVAERPCFRVVILNEANDAQGEKGLLRT